ncbi:MAG: hypothetical protein IT233_00305 [Bacteroidia bacterium]|nr:hypothetical protein [Bacteroidia bacterium]
MKKDISIPKVEDVAVAVVREKNEAGDEGWYVYLLNLGNTMLEGVLVTSKGYGEMKGEQRNTSVLRHFLDTIPGGGAVRIEPIMEELFGLTNEYWVSFYKSNVMYDKKYIFLAESINAGLFTQVPLLNKKGVMIR